MKWLIENWILVLACGLGAVELALLLLLAMKATSAPQIETDEPEASIAERRREVAREATASGLWKPRLPWWGFPLLLVTFGRVNRAVADLIRRHVVLVQSHDPNARLYHSAGRLPRYEVETNSHLSFTNEGHAELASLFGKAWSRILAEDQFMELADAYANALVSGGNAEDKRAALLRYVRDQAELKAATTCTPAPIVPPETRHGMNAGTSTDEVAAADPLPAIRHAIANYHYALDTRQHGGVASGEAVHAISLALHMPWQQGAEALRRMDASAREEAERTNAAAAPRGAQAWERLKQLAGEEYGDAAASVQHGADNLPDLPEWARLVAQLADGAPEGLQAKAQREFAELSEPARRALMGSSTSIMNGVHALAYIEHKPDRWLCFQFNTWDEVDAALRAVKAWDSAGYRAKGDAAGATGGQAPSARIQGVPTREAAMADTSRTVYMIVFDDHDRPPEVVIGDVRAAYRFNQVSAAWNAHLFGKLRSNSRDDPRYADNITPGVKVCPGCKEEAPNCACVAGDVLACDGDLLVEVAAWMHAAYDRPPQAPEVKSILARLDAAAYGVEGRKP